jgi:hypothetical protein
VITNLFNFNKIGIMSCHFIYLFFFLIRTKYFSTLRKEIEIVLEMQKLMFTDKNVSLNFFCFVIEK